MARDDEDAQVEEEVVVKKDSGTKLAEALVVLTGVLLLVAVFTMLHALNKYYNEGLLA